MAHPDIPRSNLREFVESRIHERTQVQVPLNLNGTTKKLLTTTILRVHAARNIIELLRLAGEVDERPKSTRKQLCVEKIQDKFNELVEEQMRKPAGQALSIDMIIKTLKPDLAEELGEVIFADSPHQAYLASTCRNIISDLQTTYGRRIITTSTNTGAHL